MKAEGGEDKSHPQRKASASMIAKEIIGLDPSILSLLVLDPRGQVLPVEKSNRLPPSGHLGGGHNEVGHRSQGDMGTVTNAMAALLGGMKSMIESFKNEGIMFVDLQGQDILLALRMTRSSNAEDVCNKILKTFGNKELTSPKLQGTLTLSKKG